MDILNTIRKGMDEDEWEYFKEFADDNDIPHEILLEFMHEIREYNLYR